MFSHTVQTTAARETRYGQFTEASPDELLGPTTIPYDASAIMSASEQPLLDQVAEDGPLAEREAAAAMLRLTTALIDRVATNGGATSLVPLLNAFPDNVLMQDDGAIKLSNGTRHPSHP